MLKKNQKYASIRYRLGGGYVAVFYNCTIINVTEKIVTILANNEERVKNPDFVPYYKTYNTKKQFFRVKLENNKGIIRPITESGEDFIV
jgi:hypothetical protein